MSWTPGGRSGWWSAWRWPSTSPTVPRLVELVGGARRDPGHDARQALTVTTVFTVLGPIVAGTAVADTVGGLVEIDTGDVLPILVAALLAAVGWNLLTWWLGLPSSSSHALVGGWSDPAWPPPARPR